MGDGEGDREGQEVADRRYDPWLVEGGWMNTGVMGGDAERHSAPADRISEKTSSSHPCFTPSIPSPAKNALTGVGTKSHMDGGLLMLLPDDDSGGVAGANRISEKSVSIGCKKGESWGCTRMAGFWYMGLGDATGVSIWFAYAVCCGYEVVCEFAEEGLWKTICWGCIVWSCWPDG